MHPRDITINLLSESWGILWQFSETASPSAQHLPGHTTGAALAAVPDTRPRDRLFPVSLLASARVAESGGSYSQLPAPLQWPQPQKAAEHEWTHSRRPRAVAPGQPMTALTGVLAG